MTDKRLKLRAASAAHKRFNRAFGTELSNLVDPLLGLDVTALDEAISTPEGESTAEWIEKHTDAETVTYVKSLI